jgi:hypothetical protein
VRAKCPGVTWYSPQSKSRTSQGTRTSPFFNSQHTAAVSTSPFRKLRIAESKYGLQNVTESGYGFRIYGIEMDMYGISRGVIFVCEIDDSALTTYGFHGFTDSVRIPPKAERHSPTSSPPPPRARGIPLGLEPHHGVEQGSNLLPLTTNYRSTS